MSDDEFGRFLDFITTVINTDFGRFLNFATMVAKVDSVPANLTEQGLVRAARPRSAKIVCGHPDHNDAAVDQIVSVAYQREAAMAAFSKVAKGLGRVLINRDCSAIAARTDLCGGCSVMGVPTAIKSNFCRKRRVQTALDA